MNLLIVMCLCRGNAFMLCALDPNLYQWQNWWFDIYWYYVLCKINDNIIHMNPSLEHIYSTLYTILARFIKNIFFVLTFFFVVVYEVDFILKKAKRITKKIMMLLQMSQGRVEELIGLIDFSWIITLLSVILYRKDSVPLF